MIRTLACLMVILMHSPMPGGGLRGPLCVADYTLTEPCIGLFLMVSGALLLPVRLSYADFLKRRLHKVLAPTLFFSLFYLAVSYAMGETDVHGLFRSLLSLPFSTQGHGVLWFMYTLIGMYLLAPIISPFLERASKGELLFVLALWGVTLCRPWLQQLGIEVNTSDTSMLHTFSGYTGYFVLGYYLRRFPLRLPLWLFPVAVGSVPALYAAGKLWGRAFDTWYLTPCCAVACVAWFALLWLHGPTLSARWQRVLVNFSCCSFGIYLVHIFIMRRLIWNLPGLTDITPTVQVLLIFLSTVLLSWGVTYALACLPFGGYIVGCRHRPKCTHSNREEI